MRLLHLSDLHLGFRPRFLGPRASQRERERNEILQKAVDIALDPSKAIDMVVIAGDLFDNHRPEGSLVESSLRQLQRLTNGGKVLITVPGNHDELTYHDSVYRQYGERWPGILVQDANPAHIASLSLGGRDIHIYSLAYTAGLTRCDQPLTQLPRRDDPGLHLGVFHGSLDWNTGERSLPLKSSELARAKYDYVALGHFHRFSEHRVGQGVAVYCGAPEARGFDDLGTGKVQCVQIDGQGVKLESIAVAVRRQQVIELQLDSYADIGELRGYIAKLGDPEAIVRLCLQGSVSFDFDETELAHYAQGLFYHLEIVDNSESFSAAYVEELSREPSIRGHFVRRILAKLEQTSDPADKGLYLQALRKGLRALGGGGSNRSA